MVASDDVISHDVDAVDSTSIVDCVHDVEFGIHEMIVLDFAGSIYRFRIFMWDYLICVVATPLSIGRFTWLHHIGNSWFRTRCHPRLLGVSIVAHQHFIAYEEGSVIVDFVCVFRSNRIAHFCYFCWFMLVSCGPHLAVEYQFVLYWNTGGWQTKTHETISWLLHLFDAFHCFIELYSFSVTTENARALSSIWSGIGPRKWISWVLELMFGLWSRQWCSRWTLPRQLWEVVRNSVYCHPVRQSTLSLFILRPLRTHILSWFLMKLSKFKLVPYGIPFRLCLCVLRSEQKIGAAVPRRFHVEGEDSHAVSVRFEIIRAWHWSCCCRSRFFFLRNSKNACDWRHRMPSYICDWNIPRWKNGNEISSILHLNKSKLFCNHFC